MLFSAENLASGKISGKSGKLDAENLRKVSAVWKIWKICGSCTAAENLRKNPLTGKSAENLENLECKVYLTFHGKSGARYSAEKLTLICLENLQKMLALFIVMW